MIFFVVDAMCSFQRLAKTLRAVFCLALLFFWGMWIDMLFAMGEQMPRMTLQFGGPFLERVTGELFFPPLFDELAQEPTINRDLLKGFICRIDDFAIGRHQNSLVAQAVSFAHLEMAVLDDRRSDLIADRLATSISEYTKRFFQLTLAHEQMHCYITTDIRPIKARWHRSIARGEPLGKQAICSISHYKKREDQVVRKIASSSVKRFVDGKTRGRLQRFSTPFLIKAPPLFAFGRSSQPFARSA